MCMYMYMCMQICIMKAHVYVYMCMYESVSHAYDLDFDANTTYICIYQPIAVRRNSESKQRLLTRWYHAYVISLIMFMQNKWWAMVLPCGWTATYWNNKHNIHTQEQMYMGQRSYVTHTYPIHVYMSQTNTQQATLIDITSDNKQWNASKTIASKVDMSIKSRTNTVYGIQQQDVQQTG